MPAPLNYLERARRQILRLSQVIKIKELQLKILKRKITNIRKIVHA
jgi:hypothetical protein